MNEDKIRNYDELEDKEKEVLDVFRQMKLMSDYNRFRLYKFKVEDLIKDYEQLKQPVKRFKSSTFQFIMNYKLKS